MRLEPATARPRGGTRIHFTLLDPAFSSGSAVIKLWLRAPDGHVLRRLRIPGAAVNERDTWRFAAPAGRGTYHILARAWDVAGHRSAFARALLHVD